MDLYDNEPTQPHPPQPQQLPQQPQATPKKKSKWYLWIMFGLIIGLIIGAVGMFFFINSGLDNVYSIGFKEGVYYIATYIQQTGNIPYTQNISGEITMNEISIADTCQMLINDQLNSREVN